MSFLTGNNLDVQKVQLCEVEFTTSKEPTAVSNKSPDISISKWFTLCLSKSSCGFFSSFFNRNKLFCFSFRTFSGWPAVSRIQSQLFFWTIRQSAWCIAFDFLIWAACGSLGIKLGSMVIWFVNENLKEKTLKFQNGDYFILCRLLCFWQDSWTAEIFFILCHHSALETLP